MHICVGGMEGVCVHHLFLLKNIVVGMATYGSGRGRPLFNISGMASVWRVYNSCIRMGGMEGVYVCIIC